MFVSNVRFEAGKEQEGMLRDIMEKKVTGAKEAPGALSAECWKQEKDDAVSYTLVVRWESKACFQEWMKLEHQGGHPKKDGPRPQIQKTAAQYEVVTF